MFNPYTMVARGVWTAIIVLYLLGVINMGIFDVSNYGLNEEYMVPMLVAVLVMGLLTAIGIRRYWHDKAADDAGYDNPFDLPYDKRYDFGTAVGFILGAAGGMYAAPALVDYLFTGAGMWSYTLVAGLSAAVLVVVITHLIHFGLRKFLIKTKEYFTDISGVANDFADTVKDLLDDGKVNGSTGTATDAAEPAPQPTVFVTGQPIPADPNQKQ